MDNSSLCKMFHSLGTVPRSKPPWGHMINFQSWREGISFTARWRPGRLCAGQQPTERDRSFVQWRLSYLSAADFGASNNV